jgi:toxin ParE1/3/4
MKRLVVSDAAHTDLRNIAAYTEREWGVAQKEKYLSAISERFALLLLRPEIGVERADLATGYRSLIVGRHVIFYRAKGEGVFIVRVLHQRMDVKRHL